MPQFFFDVHDGDHLVIDQTGTELPDEAAARTEAKRTLSEIAAEEIPRDGPEREFYIVVKDERRTPLLQLRLSFHTQSYSR